MMLAWASPKPEVLYMIHINMATNIRAVNMKVPEETTSPTKIVSALFHRRRALPWRIASHSRVSPVVLFSAQREKLLNGKRFFMAVALKANADPTCLQSLVKLCPDRKLSGRNVPSTSWSLPELWPVLTSMQQLSLAQVANGTSNGDRHNRLVAQQAAITWQLWASILVFVSMHVQFNEQMVS